MVHEAGLQKRIELLNTTTLDVGQGVYRVVFVPINMEEQPLAFGQRPEEARGSVWSYVAAHGTDQEGLRGIILFWLKPQVLKDQQSYLFLPVEGKGAVAVNPSAVLSVRRFRSVQFLQGMQTG